MTCTFAIFLGAAVLLAACTYLAHDIYREYRWRQSLLRYTQMQSDIDSCYWCFPKDGPPRRATESEWCECVNWLNKKWFV